MRVGWTVIDLSSYSMAPVHRSVDREAGASPARTRHCHRGSSPQQATDAGREGAEGRPGSQETSRRPQRRTPSWKGVASSMKLGLCAGLIAGLICAAPALASPATVTVRVEGAASTLVDTARVTTTDAPISKAGHDCSGTSAGGALDRATAGNWDAGYFDGL